MDVICPKCGYIFKNHTNSFGKVCINCSFFIKPEKEAFKDMKEKYDDNRYAILDYLKNKLKNKD